MELLLRFGERVRVVRGRSYQGQRLVAVVTIFGIWRAVYLPNVSELAEVES